MIEHDQRHAAAWLLSWLTILTYAFPRQLPTVSRMATESFAAGEAAP